MARAFEIVARPSRHDATPLRELAGTAEPGIAPAAMPATGVIVGWPLPSGAAEAERINQDRMATNSRRAEAA